MSHRAPVRKILRRHDPDEAYELAWRESHNGWGMEPFIRVVPEIGWHILALNHAVSRADALIWPGSPRSIAGDAPAL